MKKRMTGAQGCSVIHQEANAYSAKCLRIAVSALEKQIPKLSEYIETFGKFKCPSCGEMYDAVYDEETGEPSLWFSHCPDCGQLVMTKDYDYGRNWDE
jgi:predicted RNA-binding Zn-ribbon protein involved in translation (DUF1610 family)